MENNALERKDLHFCTLRIVVFTTISIFTAIIALNRGSLSFSRNVVLVLTAIWPLLALTHARLSPNPRSAEHSNLLVDPCICGLWIPISLFHPWVTIISLSVALLELMYTGGWKELLRNSVLFGVGLLASGLTFGFVIRFESQPAEALLAAGVLFLSVRAYASILSEANLQTKVTEPSKSLEQERLKELTKDLEKQIVERTEQLTEKNAQLEAANQKRTHFFRNISHELRTPLTLILNPLAHAAKDNPGDVNIEIATKNSRRLLRLVNQLLDFQKLEAGKKEFNLSPVDLSHFIRVCGGYFRSACEDKSIKFSILLDGEKLKDNQVPISIIGEVDALEKITFNLLSNALKFTPIGGSIDLALTTTQKSVRFHVRDTGPGITKQEQGQLFQIFSQTKSSKSREYEGSGLGLALVKQLAEAMNGKVGVESEPRIGSTFWVEFPLANNLGTNKGVLLVDDNEVVLEALAPQLEVYLGDVPVVTARSANEARAILEKEIIGCVISDASMPEESGASLLTYVHDNHPQIGRIMLTGQADESILQESINDARINHLAYKPADPEELSRLALCLIHQATFAQQPTNFQIRDWLLAEGNQRNGIDDEFTGHIQESKAVTETTGALVLVVDDLPDMRLLIGDALKEHNYRIVTASNGERGLEIAKKIEPDLIISDWLMPQMDGPEFIKELRNDPVLYSVPTILLTAKSDDESKLIGTEIGADAFLGKPFNDQELACIVKNLLQLKKGEREARELSTYLSRIFRAMTEGVLILDADHKITNANDTMLNLLGRPKDDITGTHFIELLANDDILRLSGLDSILRRGSFENINISFSTSDADRVTLQVSGSTVKDDKENFMGAVIIAHDSREIQNLIAQQSRSMAQLGDAHNEIKNLNNFITQSVLKRYLPPSLINEILDGNISMDRPAELRRITVLFSDLCGFTPISEQIGPQAVSELLNEYLTTMNETIFKHEGTIDKFIGDSIMVIFGAPLDMVPLEQAKRAAACAIEMQTIMAKIAKEWQSKGVDNLKMRIGIHQGDAVVGNFGSDKRSDFTCIGPTVNIASRIEASCQPGEIYISDIISDFLPEAATQKAGEFELKGVEESQKLYKLVTH